MPALKVRQYVRQKAGGDFWVKGQNAFDDVVGARLVGRVEIARLCRRLERAYDHARRVGTQVERLPMQETGLRQDVLGLLEGQLNSDADDAKRHRGCHADIDARKLTNISETEQIG